MSSVPSKCCFSCLGKLSIHLYTVEDCLVLNARPRIAGIHRCLKSPMTAPGRVLAQMPSPWNLPCLPGQREAPRPLLLCDNVHPFPSTSGGNGHSLLSQAVGVVQAFQSSWTCLWSVFLYAVPTSGRQALLGQPLSRQTPEVQNDQSFKPSRLPKEKVQFLIL